MSEASTGTIDASAARAWARWFVPPFVAVLVLDQVTKFWIFSLARGTLPTWMDQHHNTGVAWGIGNQAPLLVTLITLVLIPLLAWVWWKQFRPCGAPENLAFGAVLGGAIGNAIDRVATQFGQMAGVRDFIVVDLNLIGIDYVWPTFNIADAGISGGVVALALLSLFKRPVPPPPGVQAVI